eukprot:260525-Rhodomonas_salina.1
MVLPAGRQVRAAKDLQGSCPPTRVLCHVRYRHSIPATVRNSLLPMLVPQVPLSAQCPAMLLPGAHRPCQVTAATSLRDRCAMSGTVLGDVRYWPSVWFALRCHVRYWPTACAVHS